MSLVAMIAFSTAVQAAKPDTTGKEFGQSHAAVCLPGNADEARCHARVVTDGGEEVGGDAGVTGFDRHAREPTTPPRSLTP